MGNASGGVGSAGGRAGDARPDRTGAGARGAARRLGAMQSWLVSLGIAGLAVAATTVSAQTIGRFHWWAGFILVPGALIAAAGGPLLVRGGGRAFIGYVCACLGGLVFAVGAILMIGAMGWGWPIMIILPCLAVAGTYLWRSAHPLARAPHRTVAVLALGGVVLGVTFLLMHAGRVDFGETNWWGGFMMLAALIVAGNAVELIRHRIRYRLQAITLLLGPAVLTFLLGLRILRDDWPPF